jgi:hypothetical protein
MHWHPQFCTSPAPLTLSHSDTEVFFDVETDPMRDFCYLHGILERRGGDNSTEKFDALFADDLRPVAEREAPPRRGPTCVLGQRRSSISTRNTNERSGGRCRRSTPMSAQPTRWRRCSIPLGPSISTTTWCRGRRCGRPVTIRSKRSPNSSASIGGIRTRLGLRRLSGSTSG